MCRFASVHLLPFTLGALFVLSLLSSCAPQTPSNVTTLTYASPYSPAHPFSRADITWMKWIEKESNGTVQIKPYWSGSILSSEQSMMELRHGVADIGLITPIYARGGAHFIRVQAGFYGGVTTFAQQVALYRCLEKATPQFANELHGLVVLAIQGGNLPGIVTRTHQVRTLDDLRGMRLRAPSELLPVLKFLGADPVDMPMGEVYSALAKGVIDGVIAPLDALKSLHFAEVAHYFNSLPIPRGAYAARAMGEHKWNSLTPEQQSLLQRGSAVWEHALETELLKANHAGEESARQQGMQFVTMSDDDTTRFLSIYNQLAAESAKHLERFGIDGVTPFQQARTIADGMKARGDASCGATS